MDPFNRDWADKKAEPQPEAPEGRVTDTTKPLAAGWARTITVGDNITVSVGYRKDDPTTKRAAAEHLAKELAAQEPEPKPEPKPEPAWPDVADQIGALAELMVLHKKKRLAFNGRLVELVEIRDDHLHLTIRGVETA